MSHTTVSVDVNTLQLLNDRICQTLDALNQVRWSSVYGRPVHSYMNAGLSNHGAFGLQNQGQNQFAMNSFATPVAPYAPAFGGMNTLGASYAPAFGSMNTLGASYAPAFGSMNTLGASYAPNFAGFNQLGSAAAYAPAFAGINPFTAGMFANPMHSHWGFSPYASRGDMAMNGAYASAPVVPTAI